jgi:hypothetical protein
MMIDARESKIFVRTRSQCLEQTVAGGIGIERAACDLFEEILKVFV